MQSRNPIDSNSYVKLPERFNCAEMFCERLIATGNLEKTGIICASERVSYGKIIEEIARYSQALLALGLSPGDRLAFLMPDRSEFTYLFMGAIRAGIIPVPLNTALGAADYAYILDDCSCAGVVFDDEYAVVIKSALDKSAIRPTACVSLSQLSSGAKAVSKWDHAYQAAAREDCYVLYSSGTTGKPKGVVHTHSCLPVISEIFSKNMLGREAGDIILSMPRLFTSFGMGIAMAIPFWVGATVILEPQRFTADVVANLFRKHKPTIFAAVPTFYAQLIASGQLVREEMSSLRFCLSGGEAMPAELLRRWVELSGVQVREIIGSTEAGFVYIGNMIDDIRPGTSGKPIPGYELRIVDANGDPCGGEKQGRLLVRGQSIMSRYWNNPAKTSMTLSDGWLDTGDIYMRDPDGYYVYCGRGDDMLKVGGRWISPFEIESALVAHPKVQEAAVIGRSDGEGLVKAEAWVVLRNPSHASELFSHELREHCKSVLAPYKCPKWIQFIEELPKTASGKVQRFKLRQ